MTRTAYRRLQFQTPGYCNFILSLLSTCTVFWIGNSLSDGYLNELRSSVLAMLYGSKEPQVPIGYACVADKKPSECDFFLRHEGVQILTWDSSQDPNFLSLDNILESIVSQTSFNYKLGEIVSNKRILLLGYPSGRKGISQLDSRMIKRRPSSITSPRTSLLSSPSSENSEDLEGSDNMKQRFISALDEYRSINPGAGHVSITDVCDVTSALTLIQDKEVAPFDVIISVYGEQGGVEGGTDAGQTPAWFQQLLFSMNGSDFDQCRRAPLIVFSSSGDEKRRKDVLRSGAYDFVSNLDNLVQTFARLLSTADSPPPSNIQLFSPSKEPSLSVPQLSSPAIEKNKGGVTGRTTSEGGFSPRPQAAVLHSPNPTQQRVPAANPVGSQLFPDEKQTPGKVVELMKNGLKAENMAVLKAGASALMKIAGMSKDKLDATVKEGAIDLLVDTLKVGSLKGYGGLCNSASGALWVIGKEYPAQCRSAGAVPALENASSMAQATYTAKNALNYITKK